MWLSQEKISNSVINGYRKSLVSSCPNHVVIDGLFHPTQLDDVLKVLQQSHDWQPQKHTYSKLYVDNNQWHQANHEQRFVKRDSWKPDSANLESNIAKKFVSYLREKEFMALVSRIFKVTLTDMNVAKPEINTNYFRLGPNDFVCEHADDSPGREVCMLLYLNKEWNNNAGGELVFTGKNDEPIYITPLHNRCVLFDPSSEGSEHWVNKLNIEYADHFRYNVTSWYWSE